MDISQEKGLSIKWVNLLSCNKCNSGNSGAEGYRISPVLVSVKPITCHPLVPCTLMYEIRICTTTINYHIVSSRLSLVNGWYLTIQICPCVRWVAICNIYDCLMTTHGGIYYTIRVILITRGWNWSFTKKIFFCKPSCIRIDSKTVFYKEWFKAGIRYIGDIFTNLKWKSLEDLEADFGIKPELLDYLKQY